MQDAEDLQKWARTASTGDEKKFDVGGSRGQSKSRSPLAKYFCEEPKKTRIVFDASVTVGGNGLRIPLNDKRDRSKTAEELFGGRNEVPNISLADEDGFPWISLQIPNMILKVGLVLVEA